MVKGDDDEEKNVEREKEEDNRRGFRIFFSFFLGGGCAKDYVSAGTLRARKSKSLSAGVQGPFNKRALEALGFINALSCSCLFLSILIQNGIKKHSRSNFRGSGSVTGRERGRGRNKPNMVVISPTLCIGVECQFIQRKKDYSTRRVICHFNLYYEYDMLIHTIQFIKPAVHSSQL